jgi:hypothetical protein
VLAATFCTSIGTSSSLPQSSSYRQRFRSWREPDGFRARAATLMFWATLPSPAPVHSSLVPASKKPEHCVRMSLCRRYLFSRRPLLMTISTSPVWVKTGNSFWVPTLLPP